ncbi:MAG TPA: site-specific integrase, partial [Anaerolineales bacterium]
MKRPASGFLTLEKGIEGFLHFKIAEGLSPNTIVSYRHNLTVFSDWVGKITPCEIDSHVLSKYFS